MKNNYLKLYFIVFVLFFCSCSIIDKGKIPIETNVKGIETSFARIGSVTTKYESNRDNNTPKQNVDIDIKKENNYFILINHLFFIIFIAIILLIRRGEK